jgi:hypothetical protein
MIILFNQNDGPYINLYHQIPLRAIEYNNFKNETSNITVLLI